MVYGTKNLDLILGGQKPYFDKTGLGYEKEEDEKSSKESQNNLHAFIILRRDTLLKDAFSEGKQEDRK